MLSNKSISAIQIRFFEFLYRFHIKIRYLHDKVYAKGGLYKRYTDNPESYFIHRAVFIAYVLSLFLYTLVKYIYMKFFIK